MSRDWAFWAVGKWWLKEEDEDKWGKHKDPPATTNNKSSLIQCFLVLVLGPPALHVWDVSELKHQIRLSGSLSDWEADHHLWSSVVLEQSFILNIQMRNSWAQYPMRLVCGLWPTLRQPWWGGRAAGLMGWPYHKNWYWSVIKTVPVCSGGKYCDTCVTIQYYYSILQLTNYVPKGKPCQHLHLNWFCYSLVQL